jgi:HlyD family secretion protein
VTLGISDGLIVEVLSGVTSEDKIKVWNQLKQPEQRP